MSEGTVYLVEIEDGVWLCDIYGDPGRTLHMASAKRFHSESRAKAALVKAREYRPFKGAKIKPENIAGCTGAWSNHER